MVLPELRFVTDVAVKRRRIDPRQGGVTEVFRAVRAGLAAGFENWKKRSKFRRQFETFTALQRKSATRFRIDWNERWPCYEDDRKVTPFSQHYVLHTAWAARVLARYKPAAHVDLSSNLYFNVACSAFVPINFYDYRPPRLRVEGLQCQSADLTHLPFESGTIDSISCMHVVEHIGLGRYGDPLDPDGDIKAIAELKRVTKPGGMLLYVVPVGEPRIQFNAHRIYSYEQVAEGFHDFKLLESALVPDGRPGELVYSPDAKLVSAQRYGCGCFLFRKPASL